jgi:cytoskeletal protein RodZ
VADETKISTLQLEKLETESYTGLPAAVYVRGFIIQYARFLDLPDPETLASHYLARMRAGTRREPREPGH